MWRLKAPEKKPLVKRANQDGENKRPVRRASQKKVNPNIEMGKYEQKVGFNAQIAPLLTPFTDLEQRRHKSECTNAWL